MNRWRMVRQLIFLEMVLVAYARQIFSEAENALLEKLKASLHNDMNISHINARSMLRDVPDPDVLIGDTRKGIEGRKESKIMTVLSTGARSCALSGKAIMFEFPSSMLCGEITQAYVALKGVDFENILSVFLVDSTKRRKPLLMLSSRSIADKENSLWIRLDIKRQLRQATEKSSCQGGSVLELAVYVRCSRNIQFDELPYFRLEMEGGLVRKRKSPISERCITEDQSCCLAKLAIDFEQLGWSDIIQPKFLNLFYCRGHCSFHPHHNDRDRWIALKSADNAKRCCVATDYESTTILYVMDEQIYIRKINWSASHCDCL